MGNKLILEVSRSKFLAIAILTKVLIAHSALADTSSVDYIFLLNNEQPTCQQIGKNYLEVRAFETENFYINVCRKDNQYYYLGEGKTGKRNTIFLPANSLSIGDLSLGEMYRAHNGNVAYIVSILPHQAVLTIERNGEQIAVESTEINQCTEKNEKPRTSAELQFKYPILPSYVTFLPSQGLSLLNHVKISSDPSFLDIDYFQAFRSNDLINLRNCQ